MLFIAFAHTVSSMYRCKYHFEILTFHSFFFLSLRKASKNQYYCVYFTSELKLFLPALLQVIGKRCDGGGGREGTTEYSEKGRNGGRVARLAQTCEYRSNFFLHPQRFIAYCLLDAVSYDSFD